ncbi:DNA polymerase subunit Cdc27 [Radiomyces spectabilis]|uniref:DNA polymerase subunit Cdc27 n=1 Tax=Radiomyces spectabilis TaxID=64574 RepID=UPI00221EA2C2|nr:DNA polymerase subunit Cdc27 [Radiomyces spectabilis]KAI8365966.1 DNA polymerase subunit Cdc27 [Radiomyces spectabilis]
MLSFKEFLDTTVLHEKRPVTYRLVARKLGVHVNTAKQALYEYAHSESQVHAVYCLTGTVTSDTDSYFVVRLVKDTELEEAKSSFKQLTGIHVYSVLPYEANDMSVLAIANKDIPHLTLQDRQKCGVLIHTTVSQQAGAPNKPSVTVPKPTLPSSTSSSASKSASSAAAKSAATSKVAPKSAATKEQPKSKPGSSLSEALGKRKSAFSTNKVPPTSKKLAIRKPVPPKSQPSTSEQEIHSKEESEHDTSDEELDRRLAQATSIPAEDIFSDEDEEMHDASRERKDAQAAAEDESMDEAADNPSAPASEPQTPEKADQEVSVEPLEPLEPTPPGKIRRKVLKKKSYQNERGFLVTEDVWEWETVDEEEAPKKPAPTKPASAKPTPSSGKLKPSSTTKKSAKKTGEQKSLLSFWGKK